MHELVFSKFWHEAPGYVPLFDMRADWSSNYGKSFENSLIQSVQEREIESTYQDLARMNTQHHMNNLHKRSQFHQFRTPLYNLRKLFQQRKTTTGLLLINPKVSHCAQISNCFISGFYFLASFLICYAVSSGSCNYHENRPDLRVRLIWPKLHLDSKL